MNIYTLRVCTALYSLSTNVYIQSLHNCCIMIASVSSIWTVMCEAEPFYGEDEIGKSYFRKVQYPE